MSVGMDGLLPLLAELDPEMAVPCTNVPAGQRALGILDGHC